MLRLRVLLAALGFALAIFLFAIGSVVGGTIILALAVVRTAMLLEWVRRRRQFQRRFTGRDI
jgi:hypothetical protein